ncbi:MAG TPA: Ku protein [Pirellulales bacterium]|jgi:DNA end-binding protein Ku|nr:Ku protein [Pirellulales bacterium]
MAARSSWKGFLRLSLVSIPVKAYTASSSGGGEIGLNQLHADCHSRIRYQKVCPIHGEVTQDQIVMGYEYAKGQYVVIDTAELDKLRTEGDKAISIDTFIQPEEIDPIYFTDKSYYLTPDGPAGQKSFALLQQAMVDQNLWATAQVVMHGKEQIVLVRPMEKLLSMTTLYYQSQVKAPSSFEDELGTPDIASEEMKLVHMLVSATAEKPFDHGQYRDVYTERLTRLIESKVEGKELVAAPSEEPTHVINLMDALKQSVAKVQAVKVPSPARKTAKKEPPPKKMAESARQRTPAKGKKKTG